MRVSARATDLIIRFEVSSRAYYDKKLRHPAWPGGASGITVAIGYDLGYADKTKLHADWDGRLSVSTIGVMERCLGVTGTAAQKLLPYVHALIDVPWDAAIAVFHERDIPKWTDTVCAAIPGADKLPPDCLGAIVSLAYNRGASFKSAGDRYAEMRAVRAHIMAGELAKVPDDIRAMKRLWPTVKGLRDRRDTEAALFADGLAGIAAPQVPAPKPPPDIAPPPTSPPPQTLIGKIIAALVAAFRSRS